MKKYMPERVDWQRVIECLRGVRHITISWIADCIGVHRNSLYQVVSGHVKEPRVKVRASLWNILTLQIGHEAALEFRL